MKASTLIRRMALWTAIVLAGLILLLAGLRLAIGAGAGSWLVRSQVDGREIGGQTLTLEGVSGDPMSRFHVDRLTLRDRDGVWLVAENIDIDWQASSLLAGPYRINSVAAERIAIARRPAGNDSTDDEPGSLPDLPALRLGSLVIAEIDLAEGVIGPSARIRAEASGELASLRRASAMLRLERLDAPGDNLAADLRLRNGEASGELQAEGTPDGPLSALLRLEGRAIAMSGDLAGDLDGGAGTLSLAADGIDIASANTRWTREDWQAEGAIDIREWALLPDNYRDLATRADFSARGPLRPSPALTRAHADTDGGMLEISPAGHGAWNVAVDATSQTVAAATSGNVIAQSLAWTGRIETGESGLALSGDVDATGLAVDHLAVERARGPVAVRRTSRGWAIESDLDLEAPRTDVETANRLLADTALIGFTGTWVRADRTLDFDRLTVDSGGTRLAAAGRYPLGEQPPNATGTIALDDIGVLTDQASGPVTLQVAATSFTHAQLQLDASETSWTSQYADLLAGLVASGELDRGERGWRLTGLRAQSHGLDLSADGRMASSGSWELGGDLAVSGRLPVDAIEIDGALATAFRATSDGQTVSLRTATTSRTISAGSVSLEAPRLAAETQWDGTALETVWMLEARRNGKPVNLNGTAAWSETGWNAIMEEGQLSPFAVSGSVVQENETLEAALDVRLGDRAEASLRYAAPAASLRDGSLQASLDITGHEFGGGYLATAHLGLDGPLDAMAVTLTAEGRLRTPFNLNAGGELAVLDEGVTLELTPSGKWSVHNWSAPEPVRVAYASAGINASGALRLGSGRIDLAYDDVSGPPSVTLDIDALPVPMLADIAMAPPARGTLSGHAAIEHVDGRWQGQARLAAENLTALSEADDLPEMTVAAQLDLGTDATVALDIRGGGLEASGQAVRNGPTPHLAGIAGAEGVPVSGRFEAAGSLAGLAALILPSGTELRSADIDGELDIAGVRGHPEFDGRVRVSNGHVTVAATGSTIENLVLAGHFDGNGLDLTELTAGDGHGGALTGHGQLRVGEPGLRGEAEFDFSHFTATSRPDMTIRASGDAALTLDAGGLLISGATTIDEIRARPKLNGAAEIPEIEVREINLPKGRRSYSRTVLPMRLDYRVQADNGIYVSSRSFSSEWGIDLHVTGPTGKPNLAGTASVVDGTAFAFNRRFTLEEGEVRFDGAPTDARVDLIARHARTGFVATAHVEGPVRSPTITLESEPELPEDEILSRLLFDETVSELGAFEAAQLAAQLSGQNLLNVVGQLRDLAGIDRLDVSTDEDGNIAVTGGRRFGDNVYVEVGSAGASALSQALVEWQLTPDLSVLSRISADTDASVAIRWRRDY